MTGVVAGDCEGFLDRAVDHAKYGNGGVWENKASWEVDGPSRGVATSGSDPSMLR
jgi:hypothetical protein